MFVDEMGSHTSLWPPSVRLLASRQASLLQDTQKQRQEHHPLSEHQLRRRYGSFSMATLRDPRAERSSRPRLGVLSSCQAETVGQVVLMDNLGAHKGQRVRELIEGRGASCCTCHPTPRRTSIRLFNQFVRRLFRRSRVLCARLVPRQERCWWKP